MSRKSLFFFAGAFLFLVSFQSFAQSVLDAADYRIKKYRSRKVVIRLTDDRGRPLPRFKARALMQRHQFLFGCNMFIFGQFGTPEQNERFQALFSGIFNYGTLPFYASAVRPNPGPLQKAQWEKAVQWANENQIALKGHPLIWHEPYGNPAWFPGAPEQIEPVIKEMVFETVSSFKGGIQYWDVLNEPTVAWRFKTPVAGWENKIGPVNAAESGLKWAKSANPSAQFLVNDYNLWPLSALGNILWHPENTALLRKEPVKYYPVSYYLFIARLMADHAAPDAIGLQSHMHRGDWPLDKVWRLCEKYSRLGLPLHFTEVTVLSGERRQKINTASPEQNQPWPSTEQGEKEQAEYAEKFYKLLFSHPAVDAITWWDFSDRGAWLFAPAGLVRADLEPKPAYLRLHHLIREEWWTDFKGETDSNGELSFRGFCGEYKLEFQDGSAPARFAIDCKNKKAQKFEFRVKR